MDKKKVMVVDDSKFVLLEFKKIFEDTEFEIVKFCQSGEEAIAEYGNILPDIVLMDIIMPGIDGIEASRAIRSEWNNARILVVSSLVFDEVIDSVDSFGGIGVIEKPIQREKLLETMRKAVSSGI